MDAGRNGHFLSRRLRCIVLLKPVNNPLAFSAATHCGVNDKKKRGEFLTFELVELPGVQGDFPKPSVGIEVYFGAEQKPDLSGAEEQYPRFEESYTCKHKNVDAVDVKL
jgi:hypothetical protein